jgi:hypothetical protein
MVFLPLSLFAQGNSQPPEAGCHQDIKDNHGIITCVGFSKEQMDEIEKLFHGLSKSESKDRLTIIKKLDQVLEELQKQRVEHEKRTVSDEQVQQMRFHVMENSNERLVIYAPMGDPEASDFAAKLQQVFGMYGYQVAPVRYVKDVPYSTSDDAVVVFNNAASHGGTLIYRGLVDLLRLKVKYFPWSDPNNPALKDGPLPNIWDKNVPIRLYVLPNPHTLTPN